MTGNDLTIVNTVENILTVIGLLSLVISVIKILVFMFDKNRYVNTEIRFFTNQIKYENSKKNYPVVYDEVYDDEGSLFFLGSVEFPITNIKIFEVEVRKLPYDKFEKMKKIPGIKYFINFIVSKMLLKKKIEKKFSQDILPGEYLLIKCSPPEGIPSRVIRFRVNGKIVEYDFQYNGIYGNRDMDYLREKHDLLTLFYHWFRM